MSSTTDNAYRRADVVPADWERYLSGATEEKPTLFWRDLRTSIDQVPRWAWATLAVGFGGIAYLTHRADKKKRGR